MTPTYLDLQSVMHQFPLDIYKHLTTRGKSLTMYEAAELANAARCEIGSYWIRWNFDFDGSRWIFNYPYRCAGVNQSAGFYLNSFSEAYTKNVE